MQIEKVMNNLYKLVGKDYVVWFSYATPIAYEYMGEVYASHNMWSVMTGKHLNHIQPDKSLRVPHKVILDYCNLIGVNAA